MCGCHHPTGCRCDPRAYDDTDVHVCALQASGTYTPPSRPPRGQCLGESDQGGNSANGLEVRLSITFITFLTLSITVVIVGPTSPVSNEHHFVVPATNTPRSIASKNNKTILTFDADCG